MKLPTLLFAALMTMTSLLAAQTPSQALKTLIDSEWERGLVESPETATQFGDLRFNDRWTDLSLAAIAQRQAADRSALAALRTIDRSQLSAAEQLNRDTLEWQLNLAVQRQRFREHLQPISHQGGVQTADGIIQTAPFRSLVHHQHYLARLQALPQVIEQTIALMQEGLKAGLTPPRVLMERVPAQIAKQIVTDPTQSPLYAPFLRMPELITPDQQQTLRSQAQAALRDKVVPAYQRLQAVFNTEYLPKTRSSIAAASLPDGAAYYDMLSRSFTTTELAARAIHDIGLAEVARLLKRMQEVQQQTGFKGTLAQFFEHLRSDPKFFKRTPEELLAAYQVVAKRIDPELVKISKLIPRQPYGVRAIPDTIAPNSTTAYYQPGALDGSRAGFHYVNLYQPGSRPTWEMMALSLHEAVPGHHFQFARALELPDMPLFRRTAYFVAYSEGWALYAEQLGYDMGLYDDPYERFGQLTYEMWRAVRLVVDTGMHAFGWSRQQAIDYFKAHTAKTDLDITNEVDRYIGWPGQALAYKIGQMKISELRARAQSALADKFDLRDFNDAVLATGSVPLAALERHIDSWIAAQNKR